jgi:putative ABC transport system permease protein
MRPATIVSIAERSRGVSRYFSDLPQAAANLLAQKFRTSLTMLGIVFGVGAVIGMLAIGAGARQESLRFIEELGVRNLLVQSRPATDFQELQVRRRSSPGLTERDMRILQANIDATELSSANRSMRPIRLLPKAPHDPPDLIGVRPSYAAIHNLETVEGNFFDERQDLASAPVCVLGEKAKVDLLGYGPALGKYIKVNDTWLQVTGVLRRQLSSSSEIAGAPGQDRNNAIYIPLTTYQYRFWDNSFLKDDLDGIDLRLRPGSDSIEVAKVVTAILNSTHHNVPDFSVVIPADLLAQQQRTQTIFTYVMVAIAAISLLVGGIGIMNIVLATVMERTREIGIRRATGARRNDIVRQFLAESVLISLGGGILGILFGYFLSWIIARTAEWKTIVTTSSIFIAFGVSVAVGMIFGIYPAVKASRIDPIEALRYE